MRDDDLGLMQRAVLKPDGTSGLLSWLARRLNAHVALLDSAGEPARAFPSTPSEEVLREAAEDIKRVISGTCSAASICRPAWWARMTSLGGDKGGPALLVTAHTALTPDDGALISHAAALLELRRSADERNEAVTQIREAVLHLLMAGQVSAARRVADVMKPPLAGVVRVYLVEGRASILGPGAQRWARQALTPLLNYTPPRPQDPDSGELQATLRSWLDFHAAAWRQLKIHRNTLAERIRHIETIMSMDLSRLPVRAEMHLALRLLDSPEQAGRPPAPGLDDLLSAPAARRWTEMMLAPLEGEANQQLLDTVRAWLAADARPEAAAAVLGVSARGVHRRLVRAEQRLGRSLLGGPSARGLHEFNLNTTGSGGIRDLVFRVTFGPADPSGRQPLQLHLFTAGDDGRSWMRWRRSGEGELLASGLTETVIEGSHGIRIWAGRAADPFYINPAVVTAVAKAVQVGAPLDVRALAAAEPVNLFAGHDVNAIVIEVPQPVLSGRIGYWATTARQEDGTWIRVQRCATPLIPTIFFDADGDLASKYNTTDPGQDRDNYGQLVTELAAQAAAGLGAAEDPQAHGIHVRDQLFPDILWYEVGTRAHFGFARRNGRGLTEPVAEVMFALVTGRAIPLFLGKNDATGALRDSFPYLAAPLAGGPAPAES